MNFMRVMISTGPNYGSGIGGKSSGGGAFDAGTGFLSTLPTWLSTLIMVVGVILCALFIGWLVGKIVGSLIYPNPDKESVFNLKQRLAIFAVIVVTISSTGYIIYKEQNPTPPKDDMMVGGMGGGMGGGMATIDPDSGIDLPIDEDVTNPEDNADISDSTDGETTDSEDTDTDSENGESTPSTDNVTPMPRADVPAVG